MIAEVVRHPIDGTRYVRGTSTTEATGRRSDVSTHTRSALAEGNRARTSVGTIRAVGIRMVNPRRRAGRPGQSTDSDDPDISGQSDHLTDPRWAVQGSRRRTLIQQFAC